MAKKTCPCCGHTINAYVVKVTPMIVRALVKFRQAVNDKGVNSVHLLKDMKNKPYELTRHEWNNFTRQRFLALAVKDKGKPGYWLLTRIGNGFLNGTIAIHNEVAIEENRIVRRSPEMVFVKDVIGTTPYMEKKEDIEYIDLPFPEITKPATQNYHMEIGPDNIARKVYDNESD